MTWRGVLRWVALAVAFVWFGALVIYWTQPAPRWLFPLAAVVVVLGIASVAFPEPTPPASEP